MDAKTKELLLEKIGDAIENIRPYLIADGGDVNVLDFDEDFVVHVELLGACESCPMSPMTMTAGIEEAVKRAVPEETGVDAVRDEVGQRGPVEELVPIPHGQPGSHGRGAVRPGAAFRPHPARGRISRRAASSIQRPVSRGSRFPASVSPRFRRG